MYDIIIIGGGLSGLISARLLAMNKLSVAVIEKNKYPFHRVCGEYISNEVKPFLERIDCLPSHLNLPQINRLEVTAPSGFTLKSTLDLGGFGISRYTFDEFLKNQAIAAGANVIEGKQITHIIENKDGTSSCITNAHEAYQGKIIIGAQGKRSLIDKQLKRSFIEQRSPYIGVKYHIEINHPEDLIALHNFENGYCGISKIEGNRYCLCYLTTRDNLKKHGRIDAMEKALLFKNQALKKIFNEGRFLWEHPEVINEISFASKSTQEKNIFMTGDAAGMIAPLCGNGMAMAIHGAKLLSENIIRYYDDKTPNMDLIHNTYQKEWNNQFKQRLWLGRNIQKLFGANTLTEISLRGLAFSPRLTNALIKKTHGEIIY